MKTNTLMPVIKAILNDEEFLCGGIFTKEKQYAKKYDLTIWGNAVKSLNQSVERHFLHFQRIRI